MPVLEPCGCSFSIADRSKLHIECAMHANLRASNNEAVRLLRRLMDCEDLSGWSGPSASPLCDEIDAYLAKQC